MRCGFFLVTNVLTVSRFGQKRVNVNTCVVNDRIHILTSLYNMRTYHIGYSVNHCLMHDS